MRFGEGQKTNFGLVTEISAKNNPRLKESFQVAALGLRGQWGTTPAEIFHCARCSLEKTKGETTLITGPVGTGQWAERRSALKNSWVYLNRKGDAKGRTKDEGPFKPLLKGRVSRPVNPKDVRRMDKVDQRGEKRLERRGHKKGGAGNYDNSNSLGVKEAMGLRNGPLAKDALKQY